MNAKGDLIARAMSLGLGAPVFDVTTDGPPHERVFHVTIRIGGELLGEGGAGRSKKDAERVAAESALRVLDGELMEPEDEAEHRPAEDGPGGRWPIYAAVLEAALETAVEFADEDASLDDVRRDAARLYRELLGELGHGPEAG